MIRARETVTDEVDRFSVQAREAGRHRHKLRRRRCSSRVERLNFVRGGFGIGFFWFLRVDGSASQKRRRHAQQRQHFSSIHECTSLLAACLSGARLPLAGSFIFPYGVKLQFQHLFAWPSAYVHLSIEMLTV